MNLTLYTDFSLRVLIYVGLNPGRLVSISEISEAYGISRNHLLKVVHHLAKLGYLDTVRGRGGGLRLGQRPEEIVVGQVVRHTEPDMHLAECFDPSQGACRVSPVCALKTILQEAREAFLGVLDHRTLSDLLRPRQELMKLLRVRRVLEAEDSEL